MFQQREPTLGSLIWRPVDLLQNERPRTPTKKARRHFVFSQQNDFSCDILCSQTPNVMILFKRVSIYVRIMIRIALCL